MNARAVACTAADLYARECCGGPFMQYGQLWFKVLEFLAFSAGQSMDYGCLFWVLSCPSCVTVAKSVLALHGVLQAVYLGGVCLAGSLDTTLTCAS